jgi:hypothetical protein
MKTRNLSIIAGLILAIVFVPFVNAQVQDQNGIPPTDAIAGFIVNGTTWLGDSYDSTVELIGGEGIGITQNSTTGAIMINSTDYPAVGQVDYFLVTHPGHVITIAAQSNGTTNLVEVDPASHIHSESALRFDNGGSDNGRLRYIGEQTMNFVIDATVTFDLSTGSNNDIIALFGINGVPLTHAQTMRSIAASGDIGTVSLHTITELKQNDYVSVFVGNLDSANDLEIHSLSIVAQGESSLDPDATQYGFLDSIHAIGNVTNTGCAEGEILSVQSGIFDCATAGAGGGEANTASNLSPGIGLFTTKSGVNLPFKSLGAGDGITLSQNATTVLINSTGGGSGETNTASNLNVDNATGIFAQKVGSDLQFKSLINGSGIQIYENATNIFVNGDQVHWTGFQFTFSSSTTWLSMDGDHCAFSCSAADYHVTIASKPLYLDYLEVRVTSNTMSAGQWDFRFVKLPYASIQMVFSSWSDGDTYRCEVDATVPVGTEFWLDGECASCVSGSFITSITLEYYAINDYEVPPWTFTADNLGNHTATQNLDMAINSIQNTNYIEMDGNVANGGSVRLASGDAVQWRNNAGTNDNQIGFDSNDAFIMNYDTVTEYQFNTTDFTISTNNIKGSMGCSDNDLLDYNSATDRWECLDPSTLGGGGTQMMSIIPGGGTNVAKGVTLWFGLDSGATSTTAADVRMFMSKAGTASDLRCDVLTSTTTAATTIDVAKNSVGSSLDVSYGAAATGIQTDLVDTLTFAVNDWLEIVIVNNSAGGGAKDFYLGHCSFMIEYD